MALGNIFDIAGSGMNAQSLRLNTTASNLANAQAASASADQVYRNRQPVFAAIQEKAMGGALFGNPGMSDHTAGSGVEVLGIVESDAPLDRRYAVGGMTLYVNNGTGLWPGFALRLGRPAELTRITLRASQ